jgi:type I restriction enzyme M protein
MHAAIERGDTLVEPKHLDGDYLKTFDRVIANPPFSAKSWWTPLELSNENEQENGKKPKAPNYKQVSDPYGRLVYGVPPPDPLMGGTTQGRRIRPGHEE